jgi:L-lysine exporter family protein LysE/ArgO
MLVLDDASAFHLGLAAGVASIISIGPNNLMMIREGLVRGRVLLVASLVLISEGALILGSYAMASSLVTFDSQFRLALSWGGLLAIGWFAIQALRAALMPGGGILATLNETGRSCVLRVLGVVWLNPLAYLELLLIPAAIGQSLGSDEARLHFVAGLILADIVGCYGYALGGRAVSSLLRNGLSVRLFDLASGLVLSAVALTLAAGIVHAG